MRNRRDFIAHAAQAAAEHLDRIGEAKRANDVKSLVRSNDSLRGRNAALEAAIVAISLVIPCELQEQP